METVDDEDNNDKMRRMDEGVRRLLQPNAERN